MTTVSIYRNGTLKAATYSGENLEYAKKADSKKPVHMPNGRSGSLYGSADLNGVTRWTRAHLMNPRNREDLETYELKINADNVYVYEIDLWEGYSWNNEPAENYWNSGVPLTEFIENIEDYDTTEWEILFNEKDIISSKRVTRKRMLNAVSDDYFKHELEDLLKEHNIR